MRAGGEPEGLASGVSPVRNILRCSCSSRRLPLILNAPDGRPQPLDALAGPAKTHRPCQDVADAATRPARTHRPSTRALVANTSNLITVARNTTGQCSAYAD